MSKRLGPRHEERVAEIDKAVEEKKVNPDWFVGICLDCSRTFQSEKVRELCGDCARRGRIWAGYPTDDHVD